MVQENCYLKKEIRRWRKEGIYLMKQCKLMTVWKYVSLSERFLKKISETCNKSETELWRDDSLSIFKNKSGTQLEKKIRLPRLLK